MRIRLIGWARVISAKRAMRKREGSSGINARVPV
jgi:hypothetical protein